MQLKYLTLSCLASSSFLLTTSGSVIHKRTGSETYDIEASSRTKVLILGGGVAGIIAARTLHEQGIDDFLIIEARDELGGRLHSAPFGGKVVELGANWIQGTQTGQGPVNPIWTLAKKWKINTALTNFDGSMATFDETGAVDYLDVFNKSVDAFDQFVDFSGA
ncbi:hypothetical protein H0H93_016799 [Arthromyces matolae]|nr:hypothetical protein H0H93_016799 [Arthromyces matolae]